MTTLEQAAGFTWEQMRKAWSNVFQKADADGYNRSIDNQYCYFERRYNTLWPWQGLFLGYVEETDFIDREAQHVREVQQMLSHLTLIPICIFLLMIRYLMMCQLELVMKGNGEGI